MDHGGHDEHTDDYGDWVVSVDDHLIEPPDVWEGRVPARFADRAPRVERGDDGVTAWIYEGTRTPMSGMAAVAGTESHEWNPHPMDLTAPRFAAYNDPVARAAAMDEDHVIASMLFPTYPRFCGQTFMEAADKELGLACIQAYNDWMIDVWSAAAPGRYIPLAIVPLWDPQLAAAEARRVAAQGARSISFSENPTKLGLPSIHDRGRHWDPLFGVCADTGLPISIHIGSSSEIRLVSPDAPLIEGGTLMSLAAQDTVVDWLWSGNLLRFPGLKVVLSESGIDWVPSTLERMRRVLHRWRWARTPRPDFDGDIITGDARAVGARTPFGDIPDGYDPREAFLDSMFVTLVADDGGTDVFDYLGTDNVMLETDYPHPDSSFPCSAAIASENLAHLAAADRAKVLRDNAARVYGVDLPAPAALPIG